MSNCKFYEFAEEPPAKGTEAATMSDRRCHEPAEENLKQGQECVKFDENFKQGLECTKFDENFKQGQECVRFIEKKSAEEVAVCKDVRYEIAPEKSDLADRSETEAGSIEESETKGNTKRDAEKLKVIPTSEGYGVEMREPVRFKDASSSVTFFKPVKEMAMDTQREIYKIIDAGEVEYINPADKPGVAKYIKRRLTEMASKPAEHIPKAVLPMTYGLERLAEGFAFKDGYTYYISDEQESIPVRLFKGRLEVRRLLERRDRRGVIQTEVVVIVVSASVEHKEIILNKKEASKKILETMRTVSGVRIESAANVGNHVRNLLSALCEQAEKRTVYIDSGWNHVNGKYRYLYDRQGSELNVDCGKYIETRQISDLLGAWNRAIGVFSEPSLAGPILLYALLGVTYFLFERAGRRPTTLLFIAGETGSFKTALSKVFFRIFNIGDDEPVFSFKSTEAAIEPNIRDATDQTLLMDDFCPNTMQDKAACGAMKRNFDSLIRYYGDAAPKQKSNLKGDKVETPRPRGGAVITGEVSVEIRSSILRTVLLEIRKGQISGEKLAYFQDHPGLWQGMMAMYISYLENHFDELVVYIKDNYNPCRESIQKMGITEPRSVDHYVEYVILSCIWGNYMLSNGVSSENVAKMQNDMLFGVEYHIRQTEEMSRNADPHQEILKTMLEVIDSGQLKLADTRENYKSNPSYNGYYEGGNAYIETDPFRQVLDGALRKKNRLGQTAISINWRTTLGTLADKYHVIQKFSNGKDTCYTTKIKKGEQDQRKSAYLLFVDVLRQLVEEMA